MPIPKYTCQNCNATLGECPRCGALVHLTAKITNDEGERIARRIDEFNHLGGSYSDDEIIHDLQTEHGFTEKAARELLMLVGKYGALGFRYSRCWRYEEDGNGGF